MRIGFAGTPIFAETQLQALLGTEHEIVVIYTQPDKPAGRGRSLTASPVKTLALQHGIPIEQPTTLKTPDATKTLAQYAPDVLIVAAYGLLLPEAFLKTPSLGCVNVHASLLPRWRGASPIQQAILSGDPESGITLMQMDIGLDTGDIIAQEKIHLSPQETTASLHDKLASLGAKLLTAQIDHLATLPRLPQDPQKVTHAPKITKAQANILWTQTATQIEQHIRAFNPWPVATCQVGNQTLRIWAGEIYTLKTQASPGTIVSLEDHCPIIATGDGQGLKLTQGQMPGKKIMDFPALLRGHPTLFTPGEMLTSDVNEQPEKKS